MYFCFKLCYILIITIFLAKGDLPAHFHSRKNRAAYEVKHEFKPVELKITLRCYSIKIFDTTENLQ